jgi:PAS domain S-box-containing protein
VNPDAWSADPARRAGVAAVTADKDLEAIDLIARHAVLMEAATDAIVVIDEQSTIVDANRAAGEMFGFARSDLLGIPLRELQAPELRARHASAMDRYLQSGDRSVSWHGVQVTARDRSGREFPVEISFGAFTERGQRRFLGVIRDASERIRIETQLRQAQKMEALGLLAGGIAHDFNNLLTAIVGYADLVDAGLDSQHAVRADLARIRATADRATAMTTRLLAFSRREVIEPIVLDPAAALFSLVPLLERLMDAPGTLLIDAPVGRYGVRMDPTQFDRIIINMAVNARDAMPDGGTLTVRIGDDASGACTTSAAGARAATGPHESLVLTMADTGVGIAPGAVEHIFDPFFTTKSGDAGTGLGLATVHGIVHQAGGSISVDSVMDHGSVFHVRLPLSPCPTPAPHDPVRADQPVEEAVRTRRPPDPIVHVTGLPTGH